MAVLSCVGSGGAAIVGPGLEFNKVAARCIARGITAVGAETEDQLVAVTALCTRGGAQGATVRPVPSAADPSLATFREDRAVAYRARFALAVMVMVSVVMSVVKWNRLDTAGFLVAVALAFVVNQVRERVTVTEREILLVRTFWTRSIDRSSVQHIRQFHIAGPLLVLIPEHGPDVGRLRRLVGFFDNRYGVVLAFGGEMPTARLAQLLGVPVVTESQG